MLTLRVSSSTNSQTGVCESYETLCNLFRDCLLPTVLLILDLFSRRTVVLLRMACRISKNVLKAANEWVE